MCCKRTCVQNAIHAHGVLYGYRDIVKFVFTQDDWPPSLVHFCRQCQALKIPTQKVIKHVPLLPHKIRQGLTPKKQHEVVTMATFINSECKKYGITQVLDIGAGLGYVDQLLHHWYGHHVLGLEVDAERVSRAACRQSDLCPSSAVKYLTLRISAESCLTIENEIWNSVYSSNNNCTCGTSNIQSSGYSVSKKKSLPETCINGCEQRSARTPDYYSEERNESSHICSGGQCNAEGPFSHSDSGSFGAATVPVCMMGLHTCGDLTVDGLRLFFQLASVKLLVIVPCCYHKMSLAENVGVTEEKFCNFPLSSSLCHLVHSAAFCDAVYFLRRPFLRLASQVTAAKWKQCTEEDHKQQSLQLMARAVLQLYAHNEDLVLRKKYRRGVRKTSRSTFDSFMGDALKRYEFVGANERQYESPTILCKVEELWHHSKASCHAAKILTVLQMAVQGVAESFILADRAAYLQEHAVSFVDIVQVMDEHVSPRCLALVARK